MGQASLPQSTLLAQQCFEMRPRLRDDVIFRPQRVAGRVIYVVEDPMVSKFYRMGRVEYLFAASWDGQRTVRESLALANRQANQRSESQVFHSEQPAPGEPESEDPQGGQQPVAQADPLSETEALSI